jgi:hypothetical protein
MMLGRLKHARRVVARSLQLGFLLLLAFTCLVQCSYFDQVEVVKLGEACEHGCGGFALCEGELYCCYPKSETADERKCVERIADCRPRRPAGDGMDSRLDGLTADVAPWDCNRRCASGVGCADSRGCTCCQRGQWCGWGSGGRARCVSSEAGPAPDGPPADLRPGADLSGDRQP